MRNRCGPGHPPKTIGLTLISVFRRYVVSCSKVETWRPNSLSMTHSPAKAKAQGMAVAQMFRLVVIRSWGISDCSLTQIQTLRQSTVVVLISARPWRNLTYRAEGVTYHREYFVSAPDQVAAIHLTADRESMLNLRVALDRPERGITKTITNDTLLMTGQLPDGKGGGGVRYAVRVKVISKGGQVVVEDGEIQIDDAD